MRVRIIHRWAVVVRWTIVAVLFASVVGNSANARAADPAEKAESLEFDPKSGQWIEEAPPEPGTADGDLRIVRRLHANGENDKANRAIKKWLKTYGEDHELYPNAVLVRAKIRVARRDYYEAHEELKSFLASYAGTEYADQAMQIEFVIAERFLNGTKRKIWGFRIAKADDIGIAILDDLATNYPDSTIAELAILTKADYYFRSGDFAFAEHEYATLMSRFPRSRYTRKSLIQTARAALASFGGTEYDDAPLIEAYERFRQYTIQYAGAAEEEGIGLILDDITETRAAKELNIADYYVRAGHPDAAIFYYRSTITNWSESIAAVKAHDRLSEMGASEAEVGSELYDSSDPYDASRESSDESGEVPIESTEPTSDSPSPPKRPADDRKTNMEREAMQRIIDIDQPDN